MIYVYVIIILLVLVLFYFFITFNNLVKLNNRVKESFSTMDVYLKKRWDLIPNIVNVVKGYSDYEKSTLESIIKIRSLAFDTLSNDEKIESDNSITDSISKLTLLKEDYPELKANKNYLQLSENLTKIENDIANSRKYYNGTVRIFNNKVEMFPSNIVAKILGYKSKEMFIINDNERENINVKL